MKEKVDELVASLNAKFGEKFTIEDGKKYYKIIMDGSSAYAFIAKQSFRTKGLGSVDAGDIMKPAGYSSPAKHARGNIHNKNTWDCCQQYSVMYLK